MPEEKTLQDTTEGVEEEVEVEATEETTEETEEVEETEETTEEDTYTPPTKEEYEKTLQERDNYKKGNNIAKAKLKKLEKGNTETPKESEFVTKAELQKDKESTAIKDVLAESPEMDADWTKFVGYIPKVSSSDDSEAIKKKIRAGYAGYKSTLEEDDSDDEDKDAKAELSKVKGKGGDTPPPTQKAKKSILNTKSTSMADWYK